ncbi:MarR family winged helix-turn-helix transcriptional regulator [Halomonas campaniensis]|uniref:MarR family transcriptional regulator n=1 Tax=Halomonas campaniensis TaxID=213554 RepID=A0A246S3Y8_9GAMM|nr:MarR family winged helix-turn-helix transcriptional regulator [Halomonas campaniensis]OWV31182.1 MarR family transcriptional regulator [Halomonas campaniensis]
MFSKDELELDHFLPYRLSRLADIISQSLADLYIVKYQLNIPQWRVLAWMSHSNEISAKNICALTSMDKAKVSRAIQVLEGRGLIERSSSPHDNRLQILKLTENGRLMLSKLIPEARGWESDLISTLSDSECQMLSKLMMKLELQAECMNKS